MATTYWEYYCYFLDRGAFIFYAYNIMRGDHGALMRTHEQDTTIGGTRAGFKPSPFLSRQIGIDGCWNPPGSLTFFKEA